MKYNNKEEFVKKMAFSANKSATNNLIVGGLMNNSLGILQGDCSRAFQSGSLIGFYILTSGSINFSNLCKVGMKSRA